MNVVAAAPLAELPKGVTRSRDIAATAYARILLLGAPKIGKTSAVLLTAPKPLLINADGIGASNYAAGTEGCDFIEIMVENPKGVGARASWRRAQQAARECVTRGLATTIVLDTITMLGLHLRQDASTEFSNYDLWNELEACLVQGIERLCELPAHLIVIGHMDPRRDTAEGCMPLIQGKSKALVPAMLADWVMMSYQHGGTPERRFLLGPQEGWNAGGRNLRKSCVIPASIPELFTELGIPQ